MKYKSKVVEIEAIKFTGKDSYVAMCAEWTMPFQSKSHFLDSGPQISIQTLEGPLFADVGHWIIKGTEGEFYPCKDSVFQRKYEEVK